MTNKKKTCKKQMSRPTWKKNEYTSVLIQSKKLAAEVYELRVPIPAMFNIWLDKPKILPALYWEFSVYVNGIDNDKSICLESSRKFETERGAKMAARHTINCLCVFNDGSKP